jgi:hypothetical protein
MEIRKLPPQYKGHYLITSDGKSGTSLYCILFDTQNEKPAYSVRVRGMDERFSLKEHPEDFLEDMSDKESIFKQVESKPQLNSAADIEDDRLKRPIHLPMVDTGKYAPGGLQLQPIVPNKKENTLVLDQKQNILVSEVSGNRVVTSEQVLQDTLVVGKYRIREQFFHMVPHVGHEIVWNKDTVDINQQPDEWIEKNGITWGKAVDVCDKKITAVINQQSAKSSTQPLYDVIEENNKKLTQSKQQGISHKSQYEPNQSVTKQSLDMMIKKAQLQPFYQNPYQNQNLIGGTLERMRLGKEMKTKMEKACVESQKQKDEEQRQKQPRPPWRP